MSSGLVTRLSSADLVEILVGGMALAFPVTLTEEAWNVAEQRNPVSERQAGPFTVLGFAVSVLIILLERG